MKNNFYFLTFFAILFIFSSCEKDDDHDHNSEVLGCTDEAACNFESSAIDDDGSCTYPAEDYLNCDGECLNDSDGDGVCDELETEGCTDFNACNYNPNVINDDGSCNYPETNYDCDGNFLGTTHTVFAGNFYYDPPNIVINIGDQVRWINNGGFHDVNGEINSLTNTPFENPESFNSPTVSEVGAIIYTHTFNIQGIYNYDCSVGGHAQSGMVGTITVQD